MTNEDRPLRVLVVDDSQPAADMLAMILESFGHELRAAYDGREAARVAAAYSPDVVFLDIGMPDIDGYETARLIRQQAHGEQPVLVALTGHDLADEGERMREAGFDHYFVKPAAGADLQALLSRLKPRRA